MIEIKCSGKDFLSLNELKDFQGSLKTLSDANYKKLKKQIEEHGFCVPFFVWQDGKSNYILDGHQREKVLRRMEKDGIEIPDKFPVVFVEAKDRKDAANKLLAINSQYGEISSDGLYGFMNDFDINFDILENLELNITDSKKLFGKEFEGSSLEKLFIDDEYFPTFFLIKAESMESTIKIVDFLNSEGIKYEQSNK